ncbi:MAG TPA: Uma2 family endonuclease [Gemmataceae bacterium]|nr:Uma2 family endonuclease [Gemmataceae bacterium]
MPTEMPRVFVEMAYENAAREYLSRLPLEHFMEATPQATQREITLESLALVKPQRPEVQVFNELLVQYPLPRRKRPGQVVPHNMIVIHSEPIKAEGSYNLPLQPAHPFCVLEYVSKSNKRKDYTDNMNKYEHDLKVPYYLMFVPDLQEMTLYRHNGEKYVSVKPNAHDRCEIPELELEVGLHGGWMRYWFRGELLPLPAELQADLQKERRERVEDRRQLEQERSEREKERAARVAAEEEAARLRAELEQLKRAGP